MHVSTHVTQSERRWSVWAGEKSVYVRPSVRLRSNLIEAGGRHAPLSPGRSVNAQVTVDQCPAFSAYEVSRGG